MPLSADTVALLNALPDPAFVLTATGQVEHANRTALIHFGQGIVGGDLPDLTQDPAAFRVYLRRASGSRQPLLGSLHPGPDLGLGHFRAHANLLIPATQEYLARLLVRLSPIEDQRFLALTRKVHELNAEVRERQHAQAVLEETLQQRNLLLRELHHRVKNNMQMLAGMLAGAQREATSDEARAILGDASRRLIAVGAVQQMLYGSESLAAVGTEELLQTVTSAVLQASGQQVHLVTYADPSQLANDLAVPVSLILNELIANALKYGRPAQGQPEIRVRLESAGDSYLLSVEDNGPGFSLVETRRRASGLGLVRGLVRQLGGSLSVDCTPGARVFVRFTDRSQSRVEKAAL